MPDTFLLECAATLGVAMIPVLELRAAIPAGLAFGLEPWLVYVLAVFGNFIPVPAIMLFLRRVFAWLRRFQWWEGKITWLEQRAHLKGRIVKKYRLMGLVLLVAIPLPGTGAWTGALVATIFDIRYRTALPCILLGILIAGAITMGVSCGVISLWV